MLWYKLLLSLIPVLWGVQMGKEVLLARRPSRVGVEVARRVVRQRQVRGNRRIYLAPVLRFITRVGQVLEAESAGHAIGFRFNDRDAVRLYYDPDHPIRLLLVAEWPSWATAAGTGGWALRACC